MKKPGFDTKRFFPALFGAGLVIGSVYLYKYSTMTSTRVAAIALFFAGWTSIGLSIVGTNPNPKNVQFILTILGILLASAGGVLTRMDFEQGKNPRPLAQGLTLAGWALLTAALIYSGNVLRIILALIGAMLIIFGDIQVRLAEVGLARPHIAYSLFLGGWMVFTLAIATN